MKLVALQFCSLQLSIYSFSWCTFEFRCAARNFALRGVGSFAAAAKQRELDTLYKRNENRVLQPPPATTRCRYEYLISLWMFASWSCRSSRQTWRIVQFICIEKRGKKGEKGKEWETAARHLLYRHLLFATLAIQTFAIRDICYRTKIPKNSEKFQKNSKIPRIANVAYSKCPIANVA